MGNLSMVGYMSDPLLTNEPIQDEYDDYDDQEQDLAAEMGDGFIDDGTSYGMAGKQDYDDSEVDTKDGIMVESDDDNDDTYPPPPLVQMSASDQSQGPYNGHDVVSERI